MASPRLNMAQSQLTTNKVTDKRVLTALLGVPREYFVPDHLRGACYVDDELDLGAGRFLIAPLNFARMLQLANIAPTDRVLDIGCLHGYTTAVLTRLGKHAVGTEIDRKLAETARRNLDALEVKQAAIALVNDLEGGYRNDMPYDVIIVEGAVRSIPQSLTAQLADGGRLVCVQHKQDRPCVSGLGQLMLCRKMGEKLYVSEHEEASATLLPGFTARAPFQF